MQKKNEFEEKIIIVTGANTGIGYETALDMAKRGATVILACRDRQRTEGPRERIMNETKNRKVFFEELDLSDLNSVREFSKTIHEKYNRLDILINNAGIFACPYGKTKDGFETQIGVNHLGHFLLTNLLLDLLKKSSPSRIINVSSIAHKFGTIRWDDLNWDTEYSSTGSYGQSKLANVLFTFELAKRLEGTGCTAVSLHPGTVDTEIMTKLHGCLACLVQCALPIRRLCFKTPRQGAETTIYCATSPEVPNHSGAYYSDCRQERLSRKASSSEDAEKLWKLSAQLVKLE